MARWASRKPCDAELAVNRFEIPFSVHLCWNKVADGHDVRKLEPQLQVIRGASLVLVGILVCANSIHSISICLQSIFGKRSQALFWLRSVWILR